MKTLHYFKFTFSLFLLLFSLPYVQAQKNSHSHIKCATVENQQRLQEEGKLSADDVFESWMAAKQEERKANKIMAGEITIPVVVHIIHNGDPIGTNENLSEAQILSQIQVLNEDFGRMIGSAGYNTNPVGTDTGIEWCMAQIDPNGNPTDGINRVQLPNANYTTAAFDSNVKPITQWDPTQYCNVWVAELSGGILGYAQFPEGSGLPGVPASGAANTDGVVMTANAFGTVAADDGTFYLNPTYNLGRTMTHEVGHWLGLRHIWGDGACGVDDFVADTPESDNPNYTCVPHTSCGTVDMIENYMDYTNDACMNIFTVGQKARIDVVMANSPRRMELATSNKCVPKTEISFGNNATSVIENSIVEDGCLGYQDVDLTLRISAEPSADATVNLVFGGTATQGDDYDVITTPNPVFLSDQNMLNIVTIRVYDDAGEESTETIEVSYTISTAGDAEAGQYNQTHTITIEDNEVAPNNFPTIIFSEDFEGGLGSFTTTTSGPVGFAGGTSASASSDFWVIDLSNTSNFVYVNDDDCDCTLSDVRLISPVLDFTSATNTRMTFDHAFANVSESFDVIVSTDGGATWGSSIQSITNISSSEGNGLYSTSWVSGTMVDLSAYDGMSNIKVAFLYNDGGNWSYGTAVDNVSILADGNAVIQTAVNIATPQDQHLFPNSTVHYYDPSTGNVMLTIENLSSHDYGCTSVSVNRAGTGAVEAWASGVENYVASKTFDIVPTTNNPAGNYNITLYYTAAEINGWAAVTSRPLTDLGIIKTQGDITAPLPSDIREFATVTSMPFGTDYAFTATFNTGFSNFVVAPETSLPVELLNFSGKHISDRWNELSWTTASEINSKLFEVQHSTDARVFKTIGIVDAAGESSSLRSYTFLDDNYKQGNNYYRLKMVDWDETFAYSDIINISLKTKATINVLPNPTKNIFNIQFSQEITGNMDLDILDMTGKIILHERLAADQLSSHSLSLEGLATGVYFIRIQTDKEHYLSKIVKE